MSVDKNNEFEINSAKNAAIAGFSQQNTQKHELLNDDKIGPKDHHVEISHAYNSAADNDSCLMF